MAKTLMLMVTAFTIAILPNFGVCILELLLTHKLYPMTHLSAWDETTHVAMNAFGSISAVILLANSFINGIIYSWMSPKFRDEARGFLTRYWYGQRGDHRPSHSF